MKTKLSMGFYCAALAGIIEIAALIAYGMMALDGQAAPVTVWAAAILGVVVQVAALALSTKADGLVPDLLGYAAGVLYAVAPVLMMQARMPVIVNIFANHVGTVGMSFISCAALFLVAVIVKIISGFMPLSKSAT